MELLLRSLLILIFFSFFLQYEAFEHNGRIHYNSAFACENSKLDLHCEANEVIHLVRANYGRFSISICNEGGKLDFATNCISFRSFLVMQDMCNQKSNCSVIVSSKKFGDPCPGTLKYLEVQYSCAPKGGAVTQSLTTKKPFLSKERDEFDLISSSNKNPSSTEVTLVKNDKDFTISENDSILKKLSINNLDSKIKSNQDLKKNNAQPTLIKNFNQLYSVANNNLNTIINNVSNSIDNFNNLYNNSENNLLATNLLPTINSKKESTESSLLKLDSFKTSSTISSVIDTQNQFCEQRFFRSLSWPTTSFEQKHTQKCPGDAVGQAHWRCSSTTKSWYPERPDLTDCKSSWLAVLKEQLTQYSSTNADNALEVLKELASQTLSKQLFADDLREIDFIVSEAIVRILLRIDTSYSLTSLNTFNSQDNVLKQLLENLVEVVSNLLTNAQDDAWIDLENSIQARQIAFKMLINLQESALFLAKTLNQDGSFSVKSQHVLVTVHVLDAETPINLLFPALEDTRDSSWIKMEDSIFLASKSLLDYANNGFTKVAFFAYNRMEDLLKANSSIIATDGLPSRFILQNQIQTNDLINSRILSTVFVTNGKDLIKTNGKQFPLSQPIIINFKHITPIAQSDQTVSQSELHGQPKCVFWNSVANDWTGDVCWLASTNSTHSTCMCNQAGHFALQVIQSNVVTNFSFNGIYPIFDLNDNSKESLIYTSQLLSKFSSSISVAIIFFIYIVLVTINGDNSELLTINRHLCFSMIMTELLLALGVFSSNQIIFCSIISALLHYFLLVMLLWCFLTTFDIYLSLIDTFDTIKCANRFAWYYILTYGGSFIILLISLIVDHNANFVNINSAISYKHCWLSIFDYLCFTFIGPAVGVILCSFVFLGISSFIVNNNFNSLQLNSRSGIDNRKYNTATLNSSLPVVNIMSGTMLKCGSYGQTGLSAQTYVNTKEQIRFEDVRKGVRLTLILILAQCLTWTSGLLHVNNQHSYFLSILFSLCNVFQAIFVVIYCTARTDSMEHHRFAPHLVFYKYLVERLTKNVNCLTDNNPSSLGVANLNQINQLSSAMSSLATTGSSCLTNSKSVCNIGNNYINNSTTNAPLATAATLINQQNQPVVTQVATQVSGILNGSVSILPNSPTIQMNMNQLSQNKNMNERQLVNQFKPVLNKNQNKQQQLYNNNYGFTGGNIYHQPVYQKNIYHPVNNVNNSLNNFEENNSHKNRTVAISMQAAINNINTLNKFSCTSPLSACTNVSQGSGSRLEFPNQCNQQSQYQPQQQQQQQHQQQHVQSVSTSSTQSVSTNQLQYRDQYINQIAGSISQKSQQQQPQQQPNQQKNNQQPSFNNTRSPIYYSSR